MPAGRHGADMIHVSTASTLVSAESPRVHAGVLCLVRRLWEIDDCDVLLNTPATVMHRVTVSGETTCWLTWEMSAVTDGVTRVVLTHAEIGLPKPPEPELDEILVRLLRDLDAVRHDH
jgi:hypothetical protein